MHYGLVAIGSRGDVQPFISLGLGLMARNHQITIIAHENFKEFIESYGLTFKPLLGNIEAMLHSPEARKVLQSGNSIAMLKYIERVGRKSQKQVNQDILKGCEGVDSIVCGALGVLWVQSIAEKTNKRWAIIQLSFPITPTHEFPFAGMDFINFSGFNRFTYWLLLKVYWNLNKKELNDFRISLGLLPFRKSVLETISLDRILTIYCVSTNLISRPADWDANIQMTGYLTPPSKNRESNTSEEAPQEIVSWLHNGEKPIYIGLGSMPVPDPEKFIRVLSELLIQTTHRYIFCYGWSGLEYSIDSDRLYCIPYINHEWLFPQCKAAIIHGGAGTVAAALKGRIPVIITSVFGDQPWWGKLIRLKKLGMHIPFNKLNTHNLIRAIEKTQMNPIQNNVKEIGNIINNEDGLQLTMAALEKYFFEN